MKIKRIVAYVLDMIIISIITEVILFIPIFGNTKDVYMETSQEYFNLVLNASTGSSDITEDEEIETMYDMQKSAQTINIITVGCIILYFGVSAYICNGQTLGKKILNLKIVPVKNSELKPHLFILRTVIITNIIPRIIMIIITAALSMKTWYNVSVYVSQIQYIIMFMILGFIIFREDERGLHDLLCDTKVISTKE